MEPVWVYCANWEIDGGRLWLIFTIPWIIIDLVLAWWISGLVLKLHPARRRFVLLGLPLFLIVASLLPIYSPISHGQTASTNVLGEFKGVQLRRRQKDTCSSAGSTRCASPGWDYTARRSQQRRSYCDSHRVAPVNFPTWNVVVNGFHATLHQIRLMPEARASRISKKFLPPLPVRLRPAPLK